MRLACVLALCAIGAVSGTKKTSATEKTSGTEKTGTSAAVPTINRHRRSSGTEVFLNIVGARPNGKNNINAPILPIQLPIQLGGHGGVTLPVLVIPVPVYTNNPDSCSATHHESPAKPEEPPLPNIPYVQIRQQFGQHQNSENAPTQPTVVPQYQETKIPQSTQSTGGVPVQIQQQLDDFDPNEPSQVTKIRRVLDKGSFKLQNVVVPTPTVNVYAPKGSLNLNLGVSGRGVSFSVDSQEANPSKNPKINFGEEDEDEEKNHEEKIVAEEKIPFTDGSPIFETSEQMIQSFIRQAPVAPELPAVLPDLQLPNRIPVTKPSFSVNPPSIPAPSPPRPDFNRSMRLRVDLTVPRSDYTEAYDVEWHAESNTARSVVEDGSTILYRAPLADGRIQFLEVQLEHAEGQKVRRCTLSPLMPASPADKAFPGLPAFDQFGFVGYTSAEGRSLVERWYHVVTSGPGEGGAAEGESLTFTHEMLIIRDRGLAVPLRYTVVTDSSVLGSASDSYIHRYQPLPAPTAAVLPDTTNDCDVFVEFHDHDHKHHDHDENRQQRDIGSLLSRAVSKFDPLREFAGPMRDTRYDSIYTKFKTQFKRTYLDPAEEAVRKNLLIKSSRFIEAGNRLASGFKMASNFLADRLDDEINQLFGVQALPEGAVEAGLLPFPYSDNDVRQLSNELGDEFDWRPLGAVSPVRFQETTCSSCWAFAVAGSTEGALFKKTNKLVPLSPQCLVDCGKPFGTNGCNGTWPSFAYDYVQARGLPAWDEYTNYQAKVLECKDKSVPPVTHISGHVNVTAFNEPALKVAIKNHAPNVVIVDAKANSFIYYKSGVLKDKRCGQNKPRLNHAVLAVGWGTKDGPHFIIKNTWTAKWGEEGYIRIAPDTCAVMERPSYALVEEPNIDRAELRAAAASVKA